MLLILLACIFCIVGAFCVVGYIADRIGEGKRKAWIDRNVIEQIERMANDMPRDNEPDISRSCQKVQHFAVGCTCPKCEKLRKERRDMMEGSYTNVAHWTKPPKREEEEEVNLRNGKGEGVEERRHISHYRRVAYYEQEEDGGMKVINDPALLPAISNSALSGHLDLITRRDLAVKNEMVALAQEIYVISLYTQDPMVTIENCKFGVQMQCDGAMNLAVYLKDPGRRSPEKFDWRELVKDVRSSGDAEELLKKFRAKGSKPAAKGKEVTVGGYAVNEKWEVATCSIGPDLVRLIPTARILAKEKLDSLRADAEADIAYMEATTEA